MSFVEPKLWDHQKRVIAMSKVVPNLALFHDMGAGKTCSTIQILRHKYAEKGILRKTLIISPLVTLPNWKKEFSVYSRVNPSDVIHLEGTGKKKLQQFLKAVTDPVIHSASRNRVIITNYEAVQSDELFEAILRWQPEILVCDEAHRLRNHSSKRAKRIAQISDLCKHKYLLTGSPILNSVADIFYQYRILDGGKTFGDNFYAFRAKYMVDGNAGWSSKPGYFPKWEARPELFAELSDKMYAPEKLLPKGSFPLAKANRVLKKDCMDLPPLIKQVMSIPLSSDQIKMYKEMRDEYLTFVESEKQKGTALAVVAQLAITKALRLQQITSGFVKADDGKEYALDDNPRLEVLRDLLTETTANNKVIVWACFRFNYIQIGKLCEELGLSYRAVHGDIPPKEKESAIEDFRTDPKVKVIICNQMSAGIGINLTEAAYSIFYSRNFSLEQDMQAESRNYRGGTKELHSKVTRIDLVAPDTIDELIAEALANKESLATKILDLKI